MGTLEFGIVLETLEEPGDKPSPRWSDVKRQARLAEEVGFDTAWVIDELQWESDDWDAPIGVWECVAMTGAVATATETIDVGTWVLSALHRSPGVTARAVETLAEISDGRFIFGFGSGHAGRQGEAFGFPPNYTVSRYEEALAIIVSLREAGRATFDGSYHTAKDLLMIPRPDGPPPIPLMLGAHGPRTMRLAVEHADIWSAFATTSSQPDAFIERFALLESTCEELGRDPATIGRSIGVAVATPDRAPTGLLADESPIQGSVGEIAETFATLADMGCTRIEVMPAGDYDATIEGLAPVMDELRG